ncbi:MAG TPA: bifunctional UDP-sugar hydrolase/5'-nucleotidase [Kofleriaceae bacterium]|nr:bifunctional UDP-sugar hydrolase/5'-nucleotidase [Kofleriaceae bacterium]
MMLRSWLVAALVACSAPAAAPPGLGPRTISIIGTNDLHGALIRLPLLAGYIANVRAARARDGGVLLVDAGDLFQGTLESNLAEGADVIRAYNAMGYNASAIGNHEFDFGPVGPAVTVKAAGEDPRGALKARIGEAHFPFLVTNIADDATGKAIDWPNTAPGTMVEIAGVRIGLIGASTEHTPSTTMPANFAGLHMLPTARMIAGEAMALRGAGAQVIVVIAHLGSECKDLDHPDDVSTCDQSEEVFHVLAEVPKGLVDVFVAGHTHAAIAHRIDGVAVIESYSSGRAFGRIDLVVDRGKIVSTTIDKPQLICPLDAYQNPIPVADCHPAPYEGRPVVADAAIQHIVDDSLARARERSDEKLGVTLAGPITKTYKTESQEGDLVTDLMREARPEADVAMTNGGGLRADLPPGELTYGALFQAMPFDNRFSLISLTGVQLRELVADNLTRAGSILSWSGLQATARCVAGSIDLDIAINGKPLDDATTYKVVTSDFLASGGDGLLADTKLAPDAVQPTDVIIREAVANVLRARKGTTVDPAAFATKRLVYPGVRPVSCHEGDAP